MQHGMPLQLSYAMKWKTIFVIHALHFGLESFWHLYAVNCGEHCFIRCVFEDCLATFRVKIYSALFKSQNTQSFNVSQLQSTANFHTRAHEYTYRLINGSLFFFFENLEYISKKDNSTVRCIECVGMSKHAQTAWCFMCVDSPLCYTFDKDNSFPCT